MNSREFRDPSIAPIVVVGLMQIFHSRSPYPCFSIIPFNNLSFHQSQSINQLGLISLIVYWLNISVCLFRFNKFLQIFSSYSSGSVREASSFTLSRLAAAVQYLGSFSNLISHLAAPAQYSYTAIWAATLAASRVSVNLAALKI